MSSKPPVGKTKNQGWQIGVRRTISVSEWKAWEMIMATLGLPWEEGAGESVYQKGSTFELDDQTRVEIRSFEYGSLIRMKWQPKEWNFASTLQIRVEPAKTGTTISVHHEWLQNAEQREAMRVYWTSVLEDLRALASR